MDKILVGSGANQSTAYRAGPSVLGRVPSRSKKVVSKKVSCARSRGLAVFGPLSRRLLGRAASVLETAKTCGLTLVSSEADTILGLAKAIKRQDLSR